MVSKSFEYEAVVFRRARPSVSGSSVNHQSLQGIHFARPFTISNNRHMCSSLAMEPAVDLNIHVLVEEKNQKPYCESVPARKESIKNHYRILASPGFANGFAAGDVLELIDDAGHFCVISRSGNICVQIFYRGSKEAAIREFGWRFGALDGWLDGGSDGSKGQLLIYTIPFEAGFQAIEEIFNNVSQQIDVDTWMYGNVYADDGTPLNWWLSC